MKRRLFTLLLGSLMIAHSIGFIGAEAKESIPENVSVIEFDKQYWLEEGETAWHKFEAPAPYCYLTDMPLENIDGYLCGWEVSDNTYYDKNMNPLGAVSYSADPEAGGWTQLVPGETYYLKIAASKGGTHYTLSAVKEVDPSLSQDKEGNVKNVDILLKSENVERFIPGEYNKLWDIYTVSERFDLRGENVIASSTFFKADHRIYFENPSLKVDSGKVTYSNLERDVSEDNKGIRSYIKAPDIRLGDGEYIYTANHYSYVLEGNGEAVRTFDVCVPRGKSFVASEKGYFFTARANDLFSDIPSESWYTDAVGFCAESKFMKGTGKASFSPELVFTRAQMVQMLANIDKVDLSRYSDMQSFNDAPKGKWYTAAVEWANEQGITKGVGKGKFAPDEKVTREQIAVFLCSFARMKGAQLPEGAELDAYTDNSLISPWARESFAQAVAIGLIKGTTSATLSPKTEATRSQIAVMAQRFDENILKPLAPSTHKGRYFLEGDTCGNGTNYEIVELSGKEAPNVLYIGMASSDPMNGYSAVQVEYGIELGCTTDFLTLEDLANGRAEEKIMNADIISVGGGDSRMLLSRLSRYGTDAVIRKAAENKTVMSGSSAGAICFGVYGTSGIGNGRYENLKATGCVDIILCPHGLEEARVSKVRQDLMKDPWHIAVVVGNSALEIKDGMYRIYADTEFIELYDKDVVGVKYWVENGELCSEELYSPDMKWRPLEELGINY